MTFKACSQQCNKEQGTQHFIHLPAAATFLPACG